MMPDIIRTLGAENATLKAENERLKSEKISEKIRAELLFNDVCTLRAENEKLLRVIEELKDDNKHLVLQVLKAESKHER